MSDDTEAEHTLAHVVFSCESGLETVLGGFDGRDRRLLMTHALQRPEQLLVSMHEQLHEELHWSTAWGLVAAMAGLLEESGVQRAGLSQVVTLMNTTCRQVHELFATTISSGAIGIPAARALLATNQRYTSFLNRGLALGGSPEQWPWQFRESAMQMLLRQLMQPAQLADVAVRGFGALRVRDVADAQMHPDVRLAATAADAASWWDETFAELLAEHPNRGGDTGGAWARVLPEDHEQMDELKAWEETVLIPRLAATARRRLEALGFAVLDQDEYLSVVESLRESFLAQGPDDWRVEVFMHRRRLSEEMLGAERETLFLDDSPAKIALCEADDLPPRASEFLLQGPDSPHVLAVFLDRAIMHRQFSDLEAIPMEGPPLLALAGQPTYHTARWVPMALTLPDVSPRDLAAMFSSLPTLTLTTLRTSLDDAARAKILELDEAFVLVDLPLRTQVPAWIKQSGRVRLRVTDLQGAHGMNLVVLQPDGLESLWMLSFRSDGGIGELAQLLDRHPHALTADLEIPADVIHRIGMVAAWIHAAWFALEEIPL